jgi:bifunctional non-homologous end joining protein LigD
MVHGSSRCFVRASNDPEGVDWRYEIKLDGFRAIGRKSGRSAQLWSRNQKDFTRRFAAVAKGIANLPSDTIIDGEIVALDVDGKPSFNLLQGFGDAQAIVFYAFDLAMLLRKDARTWPLVDRRKQICERSTLADTIRYSETFNVPVSELMRAVRRHQLEGIVAKRAGSPYRSGERSPDWVKWRANRGQEFVIGGYTPNGIRSIQSSSCNTRAVMSSVPPASGRNIPPESVKSCYRPSTAR